MLLQRFIEGKEKPPYNYKVVDYVPGAHRKSGYYFVMTEDGWEIIFYDKNGESYRHFPYFNYKSILKITERICSEDGKKHVEQQKRLYEKEAIGSALNLSSPQKHKNRNLINRTHKSATQRS